MMFVGVCLSLSVGSLNMGKVDADSKCQVSFHFDGLQAIAFGDSNKVTDGILDVAHHTPKLEIKKIEKGKETIIFNAEGKDLYKKVLNISIPNTAHKPTRHYSADMTKDTTDFRWCLDIETDLFQKQLYLKENAFYTKINFQVGEFFTENITDEKYQFAAGSKMHSFNRRIGEPGGRLQLNNGDGLVVTGLGKDISLSYQEGTSYLINITNLPPKDMMNMDHFGFYYNIVEKNVTPFMPLISSKAAFGPRPYMCGALIFSKSTIR